MAMREWVKLPVDWINDDGLRRLQWSRGGSANTAALMILIVIAHLADEETGLAKVTYSELQAATYLSRTKISEGLGLLGKAGLISAVAKASTYQLAQHNVTPWGKLPARGIYREGHISVFGRFTLRNPVEFRALKIFLLLVARRDNGTNLAAIGYDAIAASTGIARTQIRTAIDLLVVNNLVHVERIQRRDEIGYYSAYRIAHIDPYRHMGTAGRTDGTREASI